MDIFTIRDLLELIVFFVESLKESFLRTEVSSMPETPFIGYFLERYLMIPPSQISSEYMSRGRLKSFKDSDGGDRPD